MKLILLSLVVTLSTMASAHAKPAVLCSLLQIKRVIPIAEKHSKNDKNRHCTVSCMLTLKCPAEEVLTVGFLKELKDLFGPGEADIKDIEADALGVGLAATWAARSDSQCLSQCDLYYRK